MHLHTFLSLYVPIWSIGVLGDFLGPRYPAPMDLSSNSSLVAASWRNLTSTLQTQLNSTASSGILSGLSNVTFSMGMFSLHDPPVESLQFHHTSPEVINASVGTNEVDADSIYRVASVTKVFTVLAGLLELNESDWNTPLTDLFPILADYNRQYPGTENPAFITQWDKVTVEALAGQIAGVPRDGLPYAGGDLLILSLAAQVTGTEEDSIDPIAVGLPPLNISDPTIMPACITNENRTCSRQDYLEALKSRPPTFLSWSSPGYANNGFVLLGQALSALTGRSIDTMYNESIFEPLGMTSTGTEISSETDFSRSVIPGDPEIDFALNTSIVTSSGGIFSTINDLAKFGVAILNSTLLPSDQTRKWLKPISHTANLQNSLGKPWEILRYVHSESGAVTDLYTKWGASGQYGGYIVLIPDYDAGFSILTASTTPDRSAKQQLIADLISETILPALEAQAAAESRLNYAGTYTSTVEGLNSSVTLFLNESTGGTPALTVSSWTSNGSDVLEGLYAGQNLRLLPTIQDLRAGQVAFRASMFLESPANTPFQPGLFTNELTINGDWIVVDDTTYGGVGWGLFVFDVGEDGNATAVTPAVTRARLQKQA